MKLATTICNPEYCTGCSACVNICTTEAISMRADEKGFLRPVVSLEKCIDCGLCSMICPQNKRDAPNKEGNIFAALAINDNLRLKSSSGGIFSLLAENILRNGGVVFGAAMAEDFHVKHLMIDSVEKLSLLRGSKYVQSEIGDCYREVRKHLKNDYPVLFSGTPCQVDALQRFLGKEYDKLLTVDIVCHGVPSPAVLRKFIESREKANCRKAIYINFRDKEPGWSSFSTSIQFEDGTKEIDNSFYYFFVRNYCLRDSCSNCLYTSTKRVGDITLGDFWGYQESAPEYIENDDHGISVVFVNTENGAKAIQRINKKMNSTARTKEEATKKNPILLQAAKPHEHSDAFWADFPVLTWDELVDKYGIPRGKKKDWLSAEDRLYYAQPYRSRHFRHLLHCAKNDFLKKLRRKA